MLDPENSSREEIITLSPMGSFSSALVLCSGLAESHFNSYRCSGFNMAAPVRARIGATSRLRWATRRGFNGAAPVKARIDRVSMGLVPVVNELQWGRAG